MTAVLALAAVAAQTVGGAALWAWVRRRSSVTWTELLGMGAVLGTLLALACSQVLRTTVVGPVAWLLPFAIAILVLVLHLGGRVRLATVEESWRAAWGAWGPAALLGVALTLPNLLRTPITDGYISGNRYHQDLVFFEAIAQSVSRLGNADYLLIAGEPVRYHWLAYGWSGMLTRAIGAEPFFSMTRVLPILVTLAACWLAATWAQRLSDRRWVPGLAALLVVVGGYVGANQGVLLPYDSPSQAYGTVVLLAFSLAFSDILAARVGRAGLLIVFVLGFGTMAAKSSQGAVMAFGIGLVAVASLLPFTGISRSRAWLVAIVGGVGAVSGYVAIVAGAPTSDQVLQVSGTAMHASTYQGLDPFGGTLGVLIGTTALVLAAATRWIGVAWLIGDRRTRWQADTIYGIGLAVAGVVTLYALKSGTNAAWFALGASGQLAVLSAVGIGAAWSRDIAPVARRPRALVTWTIVAAGAIWVLIFLNDALARVSGAPVQWRGIYGAWLAAALTGIVLWRVFLRPGANRLAEMAAVAALTLTVLSLMARVNGQMLWGAAEPFLGPPLRSLVLAMNSNAQLPERSVSPNDLSILTPATTPAASTPSTEPTPAPSGSPEAAKPTAPATVPPAIPGPGTPGYAYSMSILEWSPALNDAALQLRAAADPSDIVAADITNIQPYPAVMTNLRFLVAGQPWSDMFSSPETVAVIEPRKQALEAFLAAPTADTAAALRALGVHWLWLRNTPRETATAVSAFVTPLVVNDQVAVLELR